MNRLGGIFSIGNEVCLVDVESQRIGCDVAAIVLTVSVDIEIATVRRIDLDTSIVLVDLSPACCRCTGRDVGTRGGV